MQARMSPCHPETLLNYSYRASSECYTCSVCSQRYDMDMKILEDSPIKIYWREMYNNNPAFRELHKKRMRARHTAQRSDPEYRERRIKSTRKWRAKKQQAHI